MIFQISTEDNTQGKKAVRRVAPVEHRVVCTTQPMTNQVIPPPPLPDVQILPTVASKRVMAPPQLKRSTQSPRQDQAKRSKVANDRTIGFTAAALQAVQHRADPQTTIPLQLHPRPIPNDAPPEPKSTNPFTLKDNREEQLKLTLRTTKACWNPPLPRFRGKNDTEDLQQYVDKRKTYFNRLLPKIAGIMGLFMPEIMRRSDPENKLLLLELSQSHLVILQKLYKWHHEGSWKGMMALFPYPSLESSKYDFNLQQGHPSASVLEAHRRVLELERACHDLTDYLCQSMSKIEYMNGFTEKHLKFSIAAISAGGGLFGAGEAFWTPPPSNLIAMERLTKAYSGDVSCQMADDSLWLHKNRPAAFTRTYAVPTELCWGMPLLALLFKHQCTLAHLDEEDKALAMHTLFEEEVAERIKVYAMDMQHLLCYGSRLTRYVRDLYKLCNDHYETLGRIPGLKHRLSLPTNCRLLTINQEGKMIAPNGQPSSLGHFALPEPSPANQNRQPLPFPDIYSSLQTDEKLLGELVAARLDKENALIRDMLMSLFGSEDDTNTITVMLRGRRNALRRMQEDSHQAKLTSILPPTASMPSALYEPEQLFK